MDGGPRDHYATLSHKRPRGSSQAPQKIKGKLCHVSSILMCLLEWKVLNRSFYEDWYSFIIIDALLPFVRQTHSGCICIWQFGNLCIDCPGMVQLSGFQLHGCVLFGDLGSKLITMCIQRRHTAKVRVYIVVVFLFASYNLRFRILTGFILSKELIFL